MIYGSRPVAYMAVEQITGRRTAVLTRGVVALDAAVLVLLSARRDEEAGGDLALHLGQPLVVQGLTAVSRAAVLL